MFAMTSDGTGALKYQTDVAKPTPTGRELAVQVFASGINRIDTYMMKGFMGTVPILGMEVSGLVSGVGPDCTSNFKIGDPVIALMSDSGQAEYAVVDERSVLPLPRSMSFSDGAAIPEQWFTAFQLLHFVGEVQPGDRVLIHAGASGVGTAAIQLCRLVGAIPYVTAGSMEKIERCKEVGAENGFNYKEKEGDTAVWSSQVLNATDQQGIDVILDCVGQTHVEGNLAVLRTDARWVLFGLMGGRSLPSAENFLKRIMSKRISLRSTTLRARSKEYKQNLIARFGQEALPHFMPSEGSTVAKLKLVVDSMYPLAETSNAYERMIGNLNVGKIVINVLSNANQVFGSGAKTVVETKTGL
jgi:tumor protein p53-inducible protein 3